jgi:hypothetical protein
VGLYADDLIITGMEEAEVEAVKAQMKGTFQMSNLGLLYFYLDIKVHQDDNGITLRQAHYAKHIVDLGGMGGYNPAQTLMEERLKLSHYSEVEEVDATQYIRLVGSLRYLVHTWSDLAFAVGYVSQFMERPMMEHQQAIKRILCYIIGTLNYILRYEWCLCVAHLIGYCDNDLPVTSTRARARAVHLIGYYDNDLPVTSTRARAQVAFCSSSATPLLAGNLSSNRWWHCQGVKQSTSLPPPS